MKRNVFLTMSGAFLFFLVLGSAKASAAEVNDGSNSGDITINGSLGIDNTDEDAAINEGSDQWINVTLDTATIFYNTSTSTKIESPDYSIQNNSGRPVNVAVSGFTKNNAVDITAISDLKVDVARAVTGTDTAGEATSTSLIATGALSNFASSKSIVTLANANGKLNSAADTAGAYGSSAKFSYSGAVSSKLSTKLAPEFTLTLLFTPKSWS